MASEEDVKTEEINHSEEASKQEDASKIKKKTKKAWLSFLIKFLVISAIVTTLFTLVFGVVIVRGVSMQPRMSDGDLVLIYRLGKNNIFSSEAIVYKAEGKTYIGRIVAQSGDVVDIDDNGYLYVNGAIQSEPNIYTPTYKNESSIEFPYTVSENSYFVLGDNRTSANDSRVFGAIPYSDVEGNVIALFRRRNF